MTKQRSWSLLPAIISIGNHGISADEHDQLCICYTPVRLSPLFSHFLMPNLYFLYTHTDYHYPHLSISNLLCFYNVAHTHTVASVPSYPFHRCRPLDKGLGPWKLYLMGDLPTAKLNHCRSCPLYSAAHSSVQPGSFTICANHAGRVRPLCHEVAFTINLHSIDA